MRRFLALLLLLPAGIMAQVSATRETPYDWACCDEQGCVTYTSHQRQDTAITACINRSLADGRTRWIQAGRYRVAVALPAPPDNPYLPAGGQARLLWTAPTTRSDGSTLTNLASYRVRYGLAPDALTYLLNVPAPASEVTIAALGSGTWYFTMTAVDTNGMESTPTAPVSKVIP